jgi:hypothetical protein
MEYEAKLKELDFRLRSGDLVELSDVKNTLILCNQIAIQKIEYLPYRISERLAKTEAERGVIVNAVTPIIDDIRTEIIKGISDAIHRTVSDSIPNTD